METLAQKNPSQYQADMHKYLPISDDEISAACMCMRYPDMELVEKYQTPREQGDIGDILAFFN
jgi:hypothetical protein